MDEFSLKYWLKYHILLFPSLWKGNSVLWMETSNSTKPKCVQPQGI